MEQTKETRVIYFSDLFFAVLYAWRKILIVALAFAVLFGGVQTVRMLRTRNAAPAELSAATLEQIADLEEKIETYQIQLSSLEYYLSESVLMNMNPYQVYNTSADIYVEAETPEAAAAVIWAYQSYLLSETALSDFLQNSGVNTAYPIELVSFQVVENTSNMLTVSIAYSDAQGAQQILSALLDSLDSATLQISKDVAEHTVSITAHPTIMRNNQTLLKQQNDYQTTLETLESNIKAAEKEITTLSTPAAAEKPTSPIIAATIGAFLGFAVVACFVWVHHFATDKVYSARTLKNRTGIKVLGCVPSPSKRNRIDKWLCKLEKRACHPEQAATAAATVRNYCGNTKQLLISGHYDEQALAVVQEALVQAGITITCCGNLLHSVEALQALPSCDAVLLVETCKKSTYTDIEATMQLITDQDKQILGCVLLNG